MTDYTADWPIERNPKRKDRQPYYDEQEELREIEQAVPLTDFETSAWCECAKRVLRPILSIDKEMK